MRKHTALSAIGAQQFAMTPERQLLKEASTLTFATWKAKVAWVRKQMEANPSELDALTHVVQRMGWDFKVNYMAEQITKGKAAAAKFKAIVATPVLTIEEIKAPFPIKEYCENYLGVHFNANHKCRCPFHKGKSTSFVIDPRKGIFTCFGGCQPRDDREFLTGDVIDLHQFAFNLPDLRAAKASLEKLAASGDAGQLIPKPVRFVAPEQVRPVDAELVSKVLAECPQVSFASNGATAVEFAKLFLERILQPDDKPIVFVNQKWPIIGFAARAKLRHRPDELQYLCCSTALRAIRNGGDAGTNRKGNLRERFFLDVEFDHMPLDGQLKIIWWLKTAKRWNLVSITFSGGKSYHGLFDIRGQTDAQVQKMIDLAKRLGACPSSLRPHHPCGSPVVSGVRSKRLAGHYLSGNINRWLIAAKRQRLRRQLAALRRQYTL